MPDKPSPQSLAAALAELAPSTADGRVHVQRLQEDPFVAVGRDSANRAAVILEEIRGATGFRTTHAEFLPAAQLVYESVSRDAASEPSARRALLFFNEDALSGAYRELLPSLAWGLHDAHQHEGDAAAAKYASGLARLLRETAEPVDSATTQGLWAELFVIYGAQDPSMLVAAWHEDPTETYDFSHRGERLEVKSARGARRRHHFSDTQVPPPPGVAVTVVSVLVQRAAGGHTALDLLVALRDRVTTASYDELLHKALAVLPMNALTARAYDAAQAAAGLRFFDAESIPRALPEEHVMEVTWLADLEHLLDRRDQLASTLTAAAVPAS